MDQVKLAAAFNEWMRRFIENPAEFDREWQSVHRFISEQSQGKTPTYGETSAAYLLSLMTS